MKSTKEISNKLIPLLFALFLVLIWEAVVRAGLVPRFILPSPSDVLKAFVMTMPDMIDHILVTLREALTGFAVAIILSLLLAMAMDRFPAVKKALYPLLIVSQTIPIIILAPLFILWFGFGILPKIIVAVLVCFFPIIISLLEGLSSVDVDMINLLKSMGASKSQIFKIVKLPASMVGLFSGLRIAATYSIMGAVIGEWLGGDSGIGFYIVRVKHSFAVDKVFAATLVVIILSMLLFKVITIIQNLSMPWFRYIEQQR
ncbi:MAG: ABC transporter permease [Bacillota bacterium]|jgi:ABC-type nitrate/sulfonate/bicarbonate transport system permease component|nr:ABC transporter permease [Bacillota bacterium]NLM07848.1 ABC transporter permease [Clostridiales Family XIII bacterium]